MERPEGRTCHAFNWLVFSLSIESVRPRRQVEVKTRPVSNLADAADACGNIGSGAGGLLPSDGYGRTALSCRLHPSMRTCSETRRLASS
jgi:hypothetical protein